MRHVYNLKRDKKDARDLMLLLEPVKLPDSISQRSNLPEPYDQESLGACTAHAGAADYDYELHKLGYKFIYPSRIFIYHNELKSDGDVNHDNGSTGRTLMSVICSLGVCPESEWPYDITKFSVTPPQKCYEDALKYQGLQYMRVATSITAVQQALAQGYCICLGIAVFDSFESEEVSNTGIVPMPTIHETALGGHEVLICGYKKINGKLYFEVRNSWGSDWGDGGYFWLPAEYITDSRLTYDMWALQKVEDGK